MKSAATIVLALVSAGCAPASTSPPPNASESVKVVPHDSGSPNEPVLLVGAQASVESTSVFERFRIAPGDLDPSFRAPVERCPDGIVELMAVHIPLGDSMELAGGASPVLAMSEKPDSALVLVDRSRKVIRVVAKRFGLVYVLVERDAKCTMYGVSNGY